MDVFRHVGPRPVDPASPAAPPPTRAWSRSSAASAPYTEADLQAQIDERRGHATASAASRPSPTCTAYVDGINAYIDASDSGRYFPGEYVLTGHNDAITNAGTIDQFKLTDLVALASVVGALFGAGGGGEVQQRALPARRAGEVRRRGGHRASGSPSGSATTPRPSSPSTTDSASPTPSRPASPQGRALPDEGSVTQEPLVYDRTGQRGHRPKAPDAARLHRRRPAEGHAARSRPGAACPTPCVVSGEHTASGHPVAVFGPQTGYFAPAAADAPGDPGPGHQRPRRLLRGPEHVRRARPRPGLRVERHHLGPGHHRHLRRRAVRRRHAPPNSTSTARHLHRRWSRWSGRTPGSRPWPTAPRPARTRMRVYRTKYGPVTHRATVGGKPVAYTTLRSSYLHEADSIIGFQMLNDPGYVTGPPRTSRRPPSTSTTPSTGSTPTPRTPRTTTAATTRSAPSGVDAELPVWARPAYEWQDWDPAANTADYTPAAAAPELGRPGLLHLLEQQAGRGVHRPRPGARARCTAATCSTTG